jgi:3-oxoacyl-[acyl-carrier protein] reductase
MTVTCSCKRGILVGGTCEIALTLAGLMIRRDIAPVLTYRSEQGLRAIREALGVPGERYEARRLDFADRNSLAALFPPDDPPFGFMVDFAQGEYEALLAAADDEAVATFFTENVSFRAALLKRMARSMLRSRRGRLVYISSAATENPASGQGFYAAAKLASEALYRNIAIEMGERGITTVILRPGYCDAGRGRAFLEKNSDILGRVPIRRALKAEEIAEAVLYLLSDGATGINGTVITMDGGLGSGKGAVR